MQWFLRQKLVRNLVLNPNSMIIVLKSLSWKQEYVINNQKITNKLRVQIGLYNVVEKLDGSV